MAEEPPNGAGEHQPGPSAGQTGLERRESVQGARPGDRAIRIERHQSFQERGGVLRPRRGVGESRGIRARIARLVFGNPLPSAAEGEERVGVLRGLAVFASDNISSSAYATEEIMRVLIIAGAASLALTMPITLAVIAVLAIVVLSDRIVIATYPDGGGSYRVASANLSRVAGLVAAAALLTDYSLTVAVSVSAGVAALTSAFPAIAGERVGIALGVITFMTVINLRGLRESGKTFAIPVYLYLVSMLGVVAYGLFLAVSGNLPAYVVPEAWLTAHPEEPLALILVLRAFASGAVALTGAEAVSNGTPSFNKPEVPHAQTTLVLMGVLFATIFGGLSFIAGQVGIVPDPAEVETVVSQLTRTLMGSPNWYYYLVQGSTALLLVIAGNTAFNAFPRLASILATDQFLPRQFSFRGDRLGFTAGIIVLAMAAALLIVVYQASVTGLIPLYTVGVFVAFTLSQGGLIRRFWGLRALPGSKPKLAMLLVGCTATGAVAVIVSVSKFVLGAWMVLLFLPLLVAAMWGVRQHYQRMRGQTEPETPVDPSQVHIRAIVPIANLELPARQALAFAEAMAGAEHAVALHITDNEEDVQRYRDELQRNGYHLPLVSIESQYRSLIGPLMAYVDAVRETHPNDTIMVVLPAYVPNHWWENLLHNQTALRIRASLLFTPGVVVATVPYHMK